MNTKLSMFAIVMVAASLIGTSEAACASNCNGYGICGAWDRCTCFGSHADPNAEDCSQRVCPYGKSSGKTTAGENHGYSECSDNGVCNRKTGLCECNDGFTGKACQRNECPSDCNGHGQCQTIETFDSTYSSLWDHDQTMVCKCDPGYEGPACERRMCPLGDDPLTLNIINPGETTYQQDEVQTITIGCTGTTPGLAGPITIKFEDWTGQVHETHPIELSTIKWLEVKEALQALPNNVVPSVTGSVVATSGTGVVITVTFSSSDNAGTQPQLTIDYADKSAAGNQPNKAAATCDGTAIVSTAVTYDTPTVGSKESKVCSGRGICDSDLGTCTCFTGFYGYACAYQTALQ